MYSKFKYKR